MKLWDKDYSLNELIEDYTVGQDYLLDHRLIKYDCLGSIAHAEMLEKIDVLTSEEKDQLVDELKNIISLAEEDQFEIKKSQEDCHTAIENHLTEKLGDIGKKIHTARSRNDQVLTALRLYYREEVENIKKLIDENITTFNEAIEKYGHITFPGYTHTRKAMPSSIEMWIGGLRDSLEDTKNHLNYYGESIDQSPLGTAAGYGVPIEIDREYTANKLNFNTIQGNPIYAQNSRGKFASGLAHIFTQIMYDLNRYATDMILFSMPKFGYFDLPDKFLTGSSIMPQKKNPDVLELMRANYHKVTSLESRIKSMMSDLITGYHRDTQLFKEAVFEALDITKASLKINELVFSELSVNEEKCEEDLSEELFATEEAYKLVQEGTPFREAYQKIAEKFK